MLFQTVTTPGIANISYVIGHGGEALVVDPRRDIEVYLEIVRQHEMTLRYALVTHRQEDFVLGTAQMARAGAQIVTGEHELFGPRDVQLRDDEDFELGGLRFRAMQTPGHTPESMSYAIYHPNVPDQTWGVLTGDALFLGSTGRTDLTDPDRTADNAGVLYDSVHERIGTLGDQTLVLPTHGPGSVCGGGFADFDRGSLGYERKYNPVFKKSRGEFIEDKVQERLPRPPYFAHVHQLNYEGGAMLPNDPLSIPMLQPRAFRDRLQYDGRAIVIDARLPEAFAGGHIPGSYSVWQGGLPIFGGWVSTPDTPVLLVVDDPGQANAAILHLARIGMDQVLGVLAGGFEAWRDRGLPVEQTGTISARALHQQRDEYAVLDVREAAEFEAGHIPGALHIYVGELEQRFEELEDTFGKDHPIAVTCGVGHRGGLGTSILARAGFSDVWNVIGGMKAWNALELPIERD